MWKPLYATVEQYKEWSPNDWEDDDTSEDYALGVALESASRAVDRFVSQKVFRQFGQSETAVPRWYTPRYDYAQARWVVEIDDLDVSEVDSVEVLIDSSNQGVYTESLTQYQLRHPNAPADGFPYTQISVLPQESAQPIAWPDSVQITAKWGWAAFPSSVVGATMLQTSRVFKRRQAPFGVTGSNSIGSATSADTTKTAISAAQLVRELDEDIEVMLQTYVKQGWTL